MFLGMLSLLKIFKYINMDRNSLRKILIKTREDTGITKTAMSFKMKMMYSNFVMFESLENNSHLDKIIEYLWILKKAIYLSKDDVKNAIISAGQFSYWLSAHRDGVCTQQSLSKTIGASVSTISGIEQGKTLPRIDMFLKIVEALGYTVTIEDL